MKQSETIGKLAVALVAAQGEMRPIVKDSTNPDFHSTYASLDAIVEAIRPVLAKHGLAIVQGTVTPESDANSKLTGFSVETMLVHTSGEWLTSAVVMPVQGRYLKGGGRGEVDAQAAGSAVSYGRRYGICALLSLTTGEDDDGRAASQQSSGAKGRAAQRSTAGTTQPPATAPSAVSQTLNQRTHMPFGKSKGTPLAAMEIDALVGAVKWARENKPVIYAQFIESAELIIDEKSAVGV